MPGPYRGIESSSGYGGQYVAMSPEEDVTKFGFNLNVCDKLLAQSAAFPDFAFSVASLTDENDHVALGPKNTCAKWLIGA